MCGGFLGGYLWMEVWMEVWMEARGFSRVPSDGKPGSIAKKW